jgi:integrase
VSLKLQDCNLFSNFINSLRSEATKKEYSAALRRYMKYHGMTKYSDMLLSDKGEKIKQYVIHLANKPGGTSKSGFFVLFAALRNFYEMNDIEDIKWRKMKRFTGEELPQHEDRCYTHEEILSLVQNADIKMKAAILLMASSGLRVGALPSLLISHLERKDDLYKISVYKGLRGKGHYYTFCTPEATKAIDIYLQFRERCGEKISSNSLLFRKDFDSDFHDQARNNIQVWNRDAINTSMYRLLIKTGLITVDRVNPKNRKPVKRSHGLRKYFETQLVDAGIHDIIIKKLMGHSPSTNMTQIYSKQSEETMLREYGRAIDFLTINEENRLKKQVEQLIEKQDEIALLKLSHKKEMDEIREEVRHEMKQQIKQLVSRLKPEIIGEVFS